MKNDLPGTSKGALCEARTCGQPGTKYVKVPGTAQWKWHLTCGRSLERKGRSFQHPERKS